MPCNRYCKYNTTLLNPKPYTLYMLPNRRNKSKKTRIRFKSPRPLGFVHQELGTATPQSVESLAACGARGVFQQNMWRDVRGKAVRGKNH